MGLIAQMRAILVQHDGGIGISGTHAQVSDALIAATSHAAILRSQLLSRIVACGIALGERLALLLREGGG